MNITKIQRALVIVTNLATLGRQDLQWLYAFMEVSGTTLAEGLGTTSYGIVTKLIGRQATKAKFINTLKILNGTSAIKKIDVILNLHGGQGKLYFADGDLDTKQLATAIKALNAVTKLRLLYSTACYGDSHADDFVTGGFTTAIGAVGVNANAATEYPTVLTMWGTGLKIRNVVATGGNILTRGPADMAAQAIGFSQANSDKNIHGNKDITINSNA
jgi:hypothetical protein